jgi:hypothetical protein
MKVASVKFEDSQKVFKLANGTLFRTHRYCCLGPGDDLRVRKAGRSTVVKCSNGEATILPIYKERSELTFGGRNVRLLVKEIESQEELEGYHRLEEYHYRGTVLHGRRVPTRGVFKRPATTESPGLCGVFYSIHDEQATLKCVRF